MRWVLVHPYRMPPYKVHHTVAYEVDGSQAGAFSILVMPVYESSHNKVTSVRLTVNFFLNTTKNLLLAVLQMPKIGVVYGGVGGVKFS